MRRDFGSGSITTLKNGKHWARLQVIVDGQPTRISLGCAATRREAVQLLNDGRRKFYSSDGKKLPKGAAHTVGSFVEQWLEQVVKPTRASTHRLYANVMKTRILPVIGPNRLDALTSADVEDLQRQAHAAGLKASTIKVMLGILSSALQQALKKDLVTKNVARLCDRVYRPEPRDDRDQAISLDDGKRLLAAAASSLYVNAYALMLYCGLRINEALAVRWADLDLDRATVRVEGQMIWQDGRRVRSNEVKTEKSRRAIKLPAAVVTALRAERKAQMGQQARANAEGFKWLNADGLVFTSFPGLAVSDSALRKDFKRCLRAAGLPRHLHPHTLRHSCASIHGQLGTPVTVVSAMLGHSNVRTTLDTYTHAFGSMHEAAAAAIDQALSK